MLFASEGDWSVIFLEILFWCAVGTFLYVHLGYPLLMALCARTPSPTACGDDQFPLVSLIIPACDEESVIENKLNNAFSLDYPAERLEVIVASDGSVDATIAIAQAFESDNNIRILNFAERRGKASVICDAAEVAKGDVLCFCDANVFFQPTALKKMVSRLIDSPHIGAVSGDVRLASHESNFGEGESLFYRIERAVQVGESNVGSMMGVDGGMYVIRRELFRRLPADTILDDFVIAVWVMNAGKRVVFEPDAVADENGTPLARQEFRRRVRVSAGAVQTLKRGDWPSLRYPVLFWQYASHKFLRWLGPFALIVIAIANLFLWPISIVYQASLAAQALVYGLAALAMASVSVRRTRVGGIPFYFVLSHVAMLTGIVKGLFDRQEVVWGRTERSATVTLLTPESDTEREKTTQGA